MHSQAGARSLISASRSNLSGWTAGIIEQWSAAGVSHHHTPVRFAFHCRSRNTTSLNLQRCPQQASDIVLCKQSSVRLISTSHHCLARQGLPAGRVVVGSHAVVAIRSHIGPQAKITGTVLLSHQLDWCANAQNTRAFSRPPAAAATTVDEALSAQPDQQRVRTAPNSTNPTLHNHHSHNTASPLSDWVVEWQTSEMARWLASRGENWLLVEGPMLPRDDPTLGRGLFTSRAVKRGESLVEVSRGLIATPQSLAEELQDAIPEEVTDWGRMAVFLVLERRRGGGSEWAPYVQAMPPLEKLDRWGIVRVGVSSEVKKAGC